MTETADAAVVGAGILGAFVALALQERGARTILVERDQIARGTTANSFAWVNATAKTTHEAYHLLNAAGVQAWHDVASEFGDRAVGIHGAGSIQWGDPRVAGSLEGHRRQLAALQAYAYPVLELSRRDLRALEPDLHFGDGSRRAVRAGGSLGRCAAGNAVCCRPISFDRRCRSRGNGRDRFFVLGRHDRWP